MFFLSRSLYRAGALASFASLALACSSASTSPPPAAAGPGDDADAGTLVDPPDATPPALDACGAQVASKCKPKNPGSVVRGLVHFDPALLGGGPIGERTLVIYLMHRQFAEPSEWALGGHPHAYKTIPKVDYIKGEASFSIDLCEFGAQMWSEDNCDFNLIAMIDRNGTNDPTSTFFDSAHPAVPDPGEPAAVKTIQISCFAASQCVEMRLDCTDGASCVSYTDPGKCTCAAKSCGGESTCTK